MEAQRKKERKKQTKKTVSSVTSPKMAFCIAIKGRGKKNEFKELKLDRANFQINQGTTAEKKFTPRMRRTVGKMDAALVMP